MDNKGASDLIGSQLGTNRSRNSVTYISSYTIVEHQVRILKLYWPIYFISELVLRETRSISHKALSGQEPTKCLHRAVLSSEYGTLFNT